MITQTNRLSIILMTVSGILLIPFLAMKFTNEVNWTASDFVVMGALLLGTGFMIEFVLRKVKTPARRIALCAGIVIVLLLVWAELAVGLFGTPFAGS